MDGAGDHKNIEELRAAVRALVAEAADLEEDAVGWDDTLVDDLGLDSIGIVGVFIDLAYDFDVAEPERDEDWSVYNTPEKIFQFALEQWKAAHRA
ncbi:acyl carrier protein [Pontivivens ytuae]|uniref:Acyl carrier protein n=1 Tax=Pontivivens ytuae TaxID=2789856 RepID=A0A7S9QF99_9RHOB|nr:acyl carrier protein [Pontivivens ytuae]QPH56031.1 acyl carrier protein [Pontivivens ytuae]